MSGSIFIAPILSQNDVTTQCVLYQLLLRIVAVVIVMSFRRFTDEREAVLWALNV